MKTINYIEPIKFNCALYILRLSWSSSKDSTKEAVLYNLPVSKKTFMEVIDGNIRNTEYQYDRINRWIGVIYRIENFGE